MAQPDLQQFKKRGLALALRAVAGVPVVPTAAANGVLLFNGSSGTEFDKIERPIDRPHFTGQPFAVGGKRAFIEGEFELYPPLTPGPYVDPYSGLDEKALVFPTYLDRSAMEVINRQGY